MAFRILFADGHIEILLGWLVDHFAIGPRPTSTWI